MITVKLAPQELHTGSIVGLRRHLLGAVNGYTQLAGAAHSTPAERLYKDVYSSCGEMAAGKAVCAFWTATVGKQDSSIPDLLPNWQVRTRFQSDPRLWIGPRDSDHQRFILVHYIAPTVYHVYGWIMGGDAKEDRWRRDFADGSHSWLLPTEALTHRLGIE